MELTASQNELSASASGKAGSKASMRSSTPPCPGSRLLLSLAPAARLARDSTRSPATPLGARSNAFDTPRQPAGPAFMAQAPPSTHTSVATHQTRFGAVVDQPAHSATAHAADSAMPLA